MVKADFSVWAFVKQCIGKDLSKITMPIILNEPLSFLQRIAEYMEYSELLNEAVKEKDPVKRMELVCAFAVSSMSSNANRIGKPFNPLLGETYELHYNNFVFVAEQVSHHPPITAFHVESNSYNLRATVQFKLRFWGKSIEVQPKGLITLELFPFNESYTWQNVNLTVHNILMGKMWVEHTGTLQITNHTLGLYCHLEFHPSNLLGQGCNRVTGELYIPSTLEKMRSASSSTNANTISKTIFNPNTSSHVLKRIIFGNWSRGLFSVEPKVWNEKEEINDPKKRNTDEPMTRSTECIDSVDYGFEIPLTGQRCLWYATPRPSDSVDYYNFTQYTIGLNELACTSIITNSNSNYDVTTDSVKNADTNTSNCSNRSIKTIPCRENSIYGQYLPPTDSRYRPDIRLFEMGYIDEAAAEKLRLEEKQRHTRKLSNSQRKNSHSNNFIWPISANNHRGNKDVNTTSIDTNNENCTVVKQFFSNNNPFKKAFTSSSHSTKNSSTVDVDNNLCNSYPTTSTSDVSSNNLQTIGPIWFVPSINPFIKQEEWRLTGDYWKRDWHKCPDLY
ncbi:Oxysterol-binding protein-related protein isoform 2 [Schistosoma japonicum]|nr:Oxysterol-binding protein-related protein isoform 2 [Schistosoma japonicum]